MRNKSALEKLAIAGLDYKHVKVNLLGHDGNIFPIMATVTKALRRQGDASREICDIFIREVTASGSYDAAMAVVFDWVTITDECDHCGQGEE